MGKGYETRKMILERSAELFNQLGYYGSSMSDVMQATGLEKGGIYRHFKNKDELALEAFNYAVDVLRKTYRSAYSGHRTAEDRLLAVLSVYEDIAENPPLRGGCPLLNTAVDTDDTHPLLNARAREVMDEWIAFLESILREGVASGEFRSDIHVNEVAVFLTSAFEGSVMVGKLYNDSQYVKTYLKQLHMYVKCCVKQ